MYVHHRRSLVIVCLVVGMETAEPSSGPEISFVLDEGDPDYDGFYSEYMDSEEPAAKAPDESAFKIRKNKGGGYAVGFDMTTQEEEHKRLQRAQRFKCPVYKPEIVQTEEKRRQQGTKESTVQTKGPTAQPPQESATEGEKEKQMDFEASHFMDIDVEGDEKESVNLALERRWEVVHIYGTRMLVNMWDTKKVFKYFEGYSPQHVEWISGFRCNVAFADKGAAKRALYNLSKPIGQDGSSGDGLPETVMGLESIQPEDLPFVNWRVGKGHNAAKHCTFLMRVATVKDVKPPKKEQARLKESALDLMREHSNEYVRPKLEKEGVMLKLGEKTRRLVKKKQVTRRERTPYARPRHRNEQGEASRSVDMDPIELTDAEKAAREARAKRFKLKSAETSLPTDEEVMAEITKESES
eukprot:g27921.t1